ncbi:Protein of unknown function DUF760 [Dillenia turbinata]|uniref:MAR-binding filament-like protein 1 n=1 Tax=Dillenia turbinata TaxID=194707 RepID=A0AAN8WHD6_9MAGN
MATTLASSFSSPLLRPPLSKPPIRLSFLRLVRPFRRLQNPRKFQPIVFNCSASSSFGEFDFKDESQSVNSSSKKSVLSDLIQEIEPFDVSLIQKDVPPTTVDAMKRTISGMLGLLPSDQFQVLIEALWEPLSKLLVSSMMTGYTLRNAEYRLCLERNLDMFEGSVEREKPESTRFDANDMTLGNSKMFIVSGDSDSSSETEKKMENMARNVGSQGLGKLTPEAQQYILQLQSRLSDVKKELREVKRKNAALQMQQFVGEEKNDLLDYLRSLQPEKVAELSEPTSPEVKETIHSVVHGLLATLSPRMHSKGHPSSENTTSSILTAGNEEDCAEIIENASLQFQPLISLTRDHLARLLFWCMLLGHYLRGLEYRMALMELLSLPSHTKTDICTNEQISG